MNFEDLALSAPLKRAIAELGHTEPTPVQAEAIPLALEGRDVIGSAATGTGKTAAFVLPALTRLETQKPTPRGAPRILVLTPTRELAAQIAAAAKSYGKYIRVTSGLVVGGVGFGQQLKMLGQRLDLLVATPGRLMDHMERGTVHLDMVEMLVLDEADRMLDMGFLPAVTKISKACPTARQSMMFTATWDDRMAKLAGALLRDPARVAVETKVEPQAHIAQHVHYADDSAHKERLLEHLLADPATNQVIVFGATKRRVDRLATTLQTRGHKVGALHGDMRQNARTKTIDDMKAGKLRVLVATDVAARGLHVNGISHVVNFDLPRVPEDYIHRIGRTGRAGNTGIAISLIAGDDRPLLRDIEKYMGRSIAVEVIAGMEAKSGPSDRMPSSRPAGRGAPNHANGPRNRQQRTGARPAGAGAGAGRSHGAPGQRSGEGRGGEGRGGEARGGEGMPAFLKRKPA